MVAHRIEADNPRGAGLDAGDALVDAEVPIPGVGAVIPGQHLIGFLGFADLVEVLRGAEVRIGASAADEFLDDGAVDHAALRLLIGAVFALIAFGEIPLVGVDAKGMELIDEQIARAFDRALGVGVLQTEEIDAARLLRDGIGDKRSEKASRMQEPRRGGGEARHLRPFGQIARGITFFEVLDRFGDVGEQ